MDDERSQHEIDRSTDEIVMTVRDPDGRVVMDRRHVTVDPLVYYDLERYLFDVVTPRFRQDGSLGAFDFFSIVIWKANRAKSRIAKRMLMKRADTLDAACRDLTLELSRASSPQERLRILMEEWGFLLPMASAILAVLWPDEFSVYDVRVCEELANRELGDFTKLASCPLSNLWTGYAAYRESVESTVDQGLTLRDKDRILWAANAIAQLRTDIEASFRVSA